MLSYLFVLFARETWQRMWSLFVAGTKNIIPVQAPFPTPEQIAAAAAQIEEREREARLQAVWLAVDPFARAAAPATERIVNVPAPFSHTNKSPAALP